MKRICFLLLITLASILSKAQYYSDRPLEMTFEQSEFFFTPMNVNPFGTKNFARASELTLDHPLLKIQRNPSNISAFNNDTLPSNYFYIDFRNSRETVRNNYGGLYPLVYGNIPRYGYYYNSNRNELTPLLSVAYFTKLSILKNSITIGGTYQVISQGEKYYAIPYDIYKNIAGTSLDGFNYAGTEGYTINDRFSGADEMYHEGHSINVLLGWNPNKALALGFKVGRFIFERDGIFGSSNLWNQQADYQSYWKSFESRIQEYSHWDYTLGLTISGNQNRVGLYAGYLNGSVSQKMNKDDESLSKSGQVGSTSWSDYQSWYESDQNWDHKGETFYGGFQWELEVRDELHFRFLYNISFVNQNLALKSSIESESENDYYYEYSNRLSESNGYSNMHDYRTGSGNRSSINNTFSAALLWKFGEDQAIRFGTIIGSRNLLTETSENVVAFSESYYYSHYVYNGSVSTWENYNKTIEDKIINWGFDSKLRTFQIPLVYQWDVNNRFDVLLGFNRSMNFWKVENSTIILYDYRERIRNDITTIEHFVGERITEPRQRLSSVTNAFLGGLIFKPSELVGIQLIVSPGFEKNVLVNENLFGLQVWLGLSMRI